MAQSKKKKQQDNDSTKEQADLVEVSANDDSPETPRISEESIKVLLKTGRERGFVTHDELNNALPQGELTSEQIEDVMAELNSMGVNVVDAADQDDSSEEDEESPERAAGNISDESRGSDDPVRMYLREMGTVELLSREGEIAIAKRIEAGRELMLGGVYESPLTVRALLQWRDEIDQGLVLLRDVIDLETTYGRINGETDDAIPIEGSEDDDSVILKSPKIGLKGDDKASDSDDDEEEEEEENEEEQDSENSNNDGEADDLNMSLAAMEDAIRQDVMDMMEDVFVTFKELSQIRDKRITQFKKGNSVNTKIEERYITLRLQLIQQMEHILLNT